MVGLKKKLPKSEFGRFLAETTGKNRPGDFHFSSPGGFICQGLVGPGGGLKLEGVNVGSWWGGLKVGGVTVSGSRTDWSESMFLTPFLPTCLLRDSDHICCQRAEGWWRHLTGMIV